MENFNEKIQDFVQLPRKIKNDYLEGELKKHKAKLHGNERKKKASRRDNKEYHGD